MLILADENVGGETVRTLRSAGFKVDWVAESDPGISDHEVFKIAQSKNCFLLTSDKELASAAARDATQSLAGILLLRLDSLRSDVTARLVLQTVCDREEWNGLYGILAPDGLRVRRIPIRT